MWLLHQIRNTLIHWKNSKCSIFFPSSVRRFEECPNRQQDNFCSKCTKSFKCSSCWQVHDESFQIQIFPWKLSSGIKLMPHWWSWTDTYLNVHICSFSCPILFCQHSIIWIWTNLKKLSICNKCKTCLQISAQFLILTTNVIISLYICAFF